MVYLQDQTTGTPSLANPLIKTMPPDNPFTAPLHVILPGHFPTLHYGYVYGYVYDPVHLRRHHNHRKHCTSISRYLTLSHQLSDASPVIGIIGFSGPSFQLDLTHDFRFY